MANILIYGSCVSRDAFTHMENDHSLLAYVARQSLISAMSKATTLLDGEGALVSTFQNRSLNGDLTSNLIPTIQRHQKTTDLILMDLTDERLGVHKLSDNSFITRSSELISSRKLSSLSHVPGLIPIGSERHWLFWTNAANKFANRLDSLNLKHKLLVINTPWAETSIEGVDVPMFRNVPTKQINEYLNKMSQYLRTLNIKVVEMPSSLAVTTESHKWGIDPFHYGDSAYTWIREQVEKAIY